ncbi:hypothetical protein KC660_02535 [Candidatus Dojkabacteria bacterium]|uniref:FecR protein domain-containing protein n=1 Tax=Candidatus Dojkabacteria bacterium TaxID=2099670 RepID=A0A955L3N7_9BACT|nr:hypothetical protein [Candidatus Dojkabacteria bacterium]
MQFKRKQNKVAAPSRLNRTHLFLFALLLLIGITLSGLELYRGSGQILGVQDDNSQVVDKIPNSSNDVYCCKVDFVQGEAEYQMSDAGWFAMQKDDRLRIGDSVRILGKGRANLVGSGVSDFVIRVGDNSRLKVVSREETLKIESTAGDVFFRNSSNEIPMEVSVDGVIFKTTNGSFLVNRNGDNNGVFVYYGNVVADNRGKVELIEQGQKYYVKNKDETVIGRAISFSYDELHDDTFLSWNHELDVKSDKWKSQLGILGDLGLPFLTLTEPENGHISDSSEVVIKGETNKNAKVYINSKEVATKDGVFEYKFELQPGKNKIEISSINYGDVKITKMIEVERRDVLGAQTDVKFENASLKLNGYATDQGINLSWTANGIDSSPGYYLVWSQTNTTPMYPENPGLYLSSTDSQNRNYLWKVNDGKQYYIRVCIFAAPDKCGSYSNEISIKAPLINGEDLNQINLEARSGNIINWSFNKPSKDGYFVVWSKNPYPTYPLRDGDHYYLFKSSDTHQATIDKSDGPGEYHIRVCQSLNAVKCGIYSNEIIMNVN